MSVLKTLEGSSSSTTPHVSEVTQDLADLFYRKNNLTLFQTEQEIKRLVNKGADPNLSGVKAAGVKHLEGVVLISAIQSYPAELVSFLIEHGADVNANTFVEDTKHPADIGMTSLYAAAFFDEPEKVDILLQAGADPNKTCAKGGRTPIFAAVASLEATKSLVNAGANLHIKDASGMTPLDYVASVRKRNPQNPKFGQIYDFLLANGATHSLNYNTMGRGNAR